MAWWNRFFKKKEPVQQEEDWEQLVYTRNGVNFDEQQLFIVRRRDMSLLSDYFRRDARRYDNGFELY